MNKIVIKGIVAIVLGITALSLNAQTTSVARTPEALRVVESVGRMPSHDAPGVRPQPAMSTIVVHGDVNPLGRAVATQSVNRPLSGGAGRVAKSDNSEPEQGLLALAGLLMIGMVISRRLLR